MGKLILFEEDWLDSDAIVHDNTTNTSFIEYANILRDAGVRNYKWCLQLHNPMLRDIDPFDPDLTDDIRLAIRQECASNPFYYFREIAKAPGHTPENPKPILANRGNMSVYWLFFNSITTYLIQIRQTGKSLTMDHLTLYLCNLHYNKKLVNLFTKDDGLRKQNMERVREIDQYIPWYLTGHKRGDVNNTEEVHFGLTANRFKGHIPATSEKFANNVGRGFTAPTYLIDEFAFLRYAEISIPAMLAGGNNARTDAEQDGIFYGTIFSTTAGKKDDPDGAYAYKLVTEAADWTESFLDCRDKKHLIEVIIAAMPVRSSGKAPERPEVHCAFNHRQLGKTDEWLRRAIADTKAEGEAADRDFGNVWTDGSQKSPLSVEDTRRIRASELVYHGDRIDPWPYTLRWQMPANKVEGYMQANKVVLSTDPSENIGRDDSTLNFRDVRTGRVVCAANINDSNTIEMANFIAHLLITYPNITWIPENKLNGSTIIDQVMLQLLARNIDPFRRIFNLVVDEYQEFKERYKDIVTNGRIPREFVTAYRRFFGFKTSASGKFSRAGLYGSVFMAAVKYTGDTVHDPVTINQILSLVVRDGRVDHPKGGKDDSVVAWLLTYWFLTNAKNLAHYGIDSKDVLCVNDLVQEDESPEKRYERWFNQNLRERIDEIVKELGAEPDMHIAMRLESRLMQLESMLPEKDRAVLAMDDLINKLREERRKKIRRY